jgi:hypothetical protein
MKPAANKVRNIPAITFLVSIIDIVYTIARI